MSRASTPRTLPIPSEWKAIILGAWAKVPAGKRAAVWKAAGWSKTHAYRFGEGKVDAIAADKLEMLRVELNRFLGGDVVPPALVGVRSWPHYHALKLADTVSDALGDWMQLGSELVAAGKLDASIDNVRALAGLPPRIRATPDRRAEGLGAVDDLARARHQTSEVVSPHDDDDGHRTGVATNRPASRRG
jgi:hypothetical protein